MTTMDISSHNPYFNHAITEKKAKYQSQCDVDAANVVGASFSDALCDCVSQTADEFAAPTAEDMNIGENVPERWSEYHLWSATPDGFVADAGVISSFKKTMLDQFGIDVDNRNEPSYEITAVQQEWLAARYDLNALENAEVSSIEHNNFLLDLVYLNVFSMDDVTSMYCSSAIEPVSSESIAESAASIKYNGPVGSSFDGTGSFIDALFESTDDLADFLMEYIAKKYGKSEDAPDYVQEWEKDINGIIERKRRAYDVLSEFFARLSSDDKTDTGYSNHRIEDCSDRLIEDFGTILA